MNTKLSGVRAVIVALLCALPFAGIECARRTGVITDQQAIGLHADVIEVVVDVVVSALGDSE